MLAENALPCLLLEIRSKAANSEASLRGITPAQLKALHTRLSASGIKLGRDQKLEGLRLILGRQRPVTSSKELSMSDAMALLDLADSDFAELWRWAIEQMESGALI